MKKSLITMMAALALSLSANAQEVMKVELKNGQVATYNVEDISRFYFEGTKQQEEPLAEGCELGIADEVVLTNSAAFQLVCGLAVDYIIWGYAKPNEIAQLTDGQLVQLLIQNGFSMPVTKPYIFVGYPEEGTEYVILYFAINKEKKRGHLYRYHLTAPVAANEPKAEVSKVLVYDDHFEVTINIDKSKVMKYFATMMAVDDDYEIYNSALTALMIKDAINAGDGIYTESRTGSFPRNSGEKNLYIATWACDYNGRWSGYLTQGIWTIQDGSRQLTPQLVDNSNKAMKKTYTHEELETFCNKLLKSVQSNEKIK